MIQLDSKTLEAILATDGYSLIPLNEKQRMAARLEVRATLDDVTSESKGTQALQQRFHGIRQLLSPDVWARLSGLPIFWVESSLPHASAIQVDGEPAVIVCRGLFDFIHFQSCLHPICSLILQVEEERGLKRQRDIPASELMSLAGHVILADAYAHVRPPATMADLLGPNILHDIELSVSTSLLLLVLHELGHVALGHTQRSLASMNVSVDSVTEPNDAMSRTKLELEADAYSISCVRSSWRPSLLGSLINLHNVFHFFEIFGVRPSSEYPSADQRLNVMVEQLSLSAKDALMAQSWLQSYRQRQTRIATPTATPGEMIRRFDSTMDIDTAYQTVARIRSDLADARIVLDNSPT